MDYIKYNKNADMIERQKVELLTVGEMISIIEDINYLIHEDRRHENLISDCRIEQIQRMIYNYENLEHWAHISGYYTLNEEIDVNIRREE